MIFWDPVTNENSPPVAHCELELILKLIENYDSGDCLERDEWRVLKEIPLWTTYVSTQYNRFDFPRFPFFTDLPTERTELWNLTENFNIPEDLEELMTAKLTCFGKESRNLNFEEFRSDWSHRSATHITSRTIRLTP